MRDLLSESKKHLKQNEVNLMEVPFYSEISVKNLYPDAIQDPLLASYLPSKEQLSNKLPERNFFFGVMCTLRRQYMVDIIKQAHDNRFKLPEDDPKKKGIVISEAWLQELKKHPYFSSKPIFHVEWYRVQGHWHLHDEGVG
jgi:hypothetical protein